MQFNLEKQEEFVLSLKENLNSDANIKTQLEMEFEKL